MSRSSFARAVTVPSAQAKEATSAREDRERESKTAHTGQRRTRIPPLQAPTTAGLSLQGLDGGRREAMTSLFPAGRGHTLVALRVRYAKHRQVDVAVSALPRRGLFACCHGWRKDILLRSLAMLETLPILHHHRNADATELQSALVPCSPRQEALSALLVQEAALEKLQQRAGRVKRRFLLLYGPPDSWLSLFDQLFATLTKVSDLLSSRLSATKRRYLQQRLKLLMTQLKAAAPQGDVQAQRSAVAAPPRDVHHEQDPLARSSSLQQAGV